VQDKIEDHPPTPLSTALRASGRAFGQNAERWNARRKQEVLGSGRLQIRGWMTTGIIKVLRQTVSSSLKYSPLLNPADRRLFLIMNIGTSG
jgi:hypothetical protein